MTIYLDTSVIVPLIVKEATSTAVDHWLGRVGHTVMTSRWAVVELNSAIGLKVRSGGLDQRQGSAVLRVFSVDILPALELIEVEPAHMTAAATLLARFELGLRAGDALHLAIAHATATSLAAFDRRLREAAVATGLDAIEPH